MKIEIRMPIFNFNFSIPKSAPVPYFRGTWKSEKALNEQIPEDSALKLKIAGFFACIDTFSNILL